MSDDILGNNLFAYCGNNPVMRADNGGQGWWIAAGAIIGGLVGGVAKVISNVSTGKKWHDGILGAVSSGAVYGAVLAATGNVLAAGFAGAATETVVNQVLSYTPLAKINSTQQKSITKENIVESIGTIVVETAINGTVSTLTGKIAGKIVPTNNGWFKPQKFISSFTGNYAVKSELQTLIQGGMISVIDMLKQYCHDLLRLGQQAVAEIFSDM